MDNVGADGHSHFFGIIVLFLFEYESFAYAYSSIDNQCLLNSYEINRALFVNSI